jgi:hypothetical protein
MNILWMHTGQRIFSTQTANRSGATRPEITARCERRDGARPAVREVASREGDIGASRTLSDECAKMNIIHFAQRVMHQRRLIWKAR